MSRFWLSILLITAPSLTGYAQQTSPTRPHAGMLRYPAVSRTHIVFGYANDLWLVPREGGTAVPLSSPAGQELFPRFSPDGQRIAFEGNYDGNNDLYVISIEGGIPFRVTHHPTGERLNGWTPDGKLLFSAGGVQGLGRMPQLFTVPPEGGMPAMLPVPYGTNGAVSPDGQWLAYTPHSTDFRTWKRYRGGMATDIWLFHLQTRKSRRMTDWEGTDTLPMWSGPTVYYLSDAGPDHRLNLWRYDTGSGKRAQITRYKDFDVKWPSISPDGKIAFQHGAELLLMDAANGETRPVNVTVPGDRATLRPRAVDTSRFISDWGISPTGKRAVIEARGDIWTAPAKEGSPRNLTRTGGVAERMPSWSPNGRWIAYLSDATGEYEFYITRSDGKGETKQLTHGGKTFRYRPVWSPDSKYIAFTDKTGSIYLVRAEGGSPKLIDKDPWAETPEVVWSHDSRWIAYPKNGQRSRNSAIWLYRVEKDEKHPITSEMFNAYGPAFDRKGDYLYFISNRTFSPSYDDLGQNWIYTGTHVLMAVPLRKDIKSPYLPKSDEESWDKPTEGEKKDDKTPDNAPKPDDGISGIWKGTAKGAFLPGGEVSFTLDLTLNPANTVSGSFESSLSSGSLTSGKYNPDTKEITLSVSLPTGSASVTGQVADGKMTGKGTASDGSTFDITAERSSPRPGSKDAPKESDKPAKVVTVDFESIEGRGMLLPVRSGRFGQLAVNDKGALIFSRHSVAGEEGAGIKLFDLNDEKKEEKTVAAGAGGFRISADGKKLLVFQGSGTAIRDAAAGGSEDKINTSGMTVVIDPREEWKQIFTDAWRIQRDFFYDPTMHGVDWAAVREHYTQMLDGCVSREDVSYVISEMISELNVGHAYYWGGDTEPAAPGVNVGMLGADFEMANGAYRIARIHEGAPWDADARSPLNQPGIDIKEGDYILAVNGVPVNTTRDPWAAFQGMADRAVTLTISGKPSSDKDARDVILRPLSSDWGLRFRAWIEKNRAYVDKETGGRAGYIYVPDTGAGGQSELVRQFYGQLHKDALIIDERWNGGGQIPTRFIELLNRPVTNYWARRDGNDWIWPPDAHQGPKCMLINGLAGSGGDAFPSYFRQAGLGKLIGTRTWGGLVGMTGNPGLIDGGYTSVPTFAFYKKNGTWGIEGHGVDPDIEVIDDPARMQNGRDPQLDTAIGYVLEELKKNPFQPPTRPPYPNRSGMGVPEKDR
ncbi:MAG: PD40 domain-containing protein [Armatimonadetes bacterium]|nr:PD40 domain-containing protein [Armatimonadota bacterium]